MRPTKKLVTLVGIFAGSALALFFVRLFTTPDISAQLTRDSWSSHQLTDWLTWLWWAALGAASLLVLIDAWLARKPVKLAIERTLPHSLALGVFSDVLLKITNHSNYVLDIVLTELLPSKVESSVLPLVFSLEANSHKKMAYPVLPIERGEALWGDTLLRIVSPAGFWFKSQKTEGREAVKVYPNFAPIAQSATVSLEHHIAQMGIHLQQRRGEGSDFHQLREFREGDSLRQIDWNATSRHRKPVSREYQDERDQEIVFLLDCGRRLRSKENDVSLFDHALNALLLTGYIALRQGDAVGFMAFGGNSRWLAPLKHPSNINTLLNQLYDLHSTTEASDYLEAAQEFLQRRKKRSLVVLLTSAREEDVGDLSDAVRLLSSKHMVMVACIRDSFFDEQIDLPVTSFNHALNYCATLDYAKRRIAVLMQLKNLGAVITDALPAELHLKLVQEYLRLKRSGKF